MTRGHLSGGFELGDGVGALAVNVTLQDPGEMIVVRAVKQGEMPAGEMHQVDAQQ